MESILNFDNFIKWFEFFGSCVPWVIIAVIVFIIFKHPTEVQIWVAIVQRLFANFSTKISKSSIENELQGRVLSASKKICTELTDILPYTVKINWVTETNRQAFFDNNRVVLCMDHSKTRNQNIVYAVNDYIEHGLLPAIKHYISDDFLKSSKLVLTKKVLTIAYKNGLIFYLNNIFYAEIEKNPKLKNTINQLTRLDESGMFVQILLRELANKGSILRLNDHDEFQKETIEFTEFLCKIANRGKNEASDLIFNKKFFKVAIILIANEDTYDYYGSKAYLYRFDQNIKMSLSDIYLCSRGKSKEAVTLKVCKDICEKYKIVDRYKVFHYNGRYKDGRDYKGVCIAFNNLDKLSLSGSKQSINYSLNNNT